MTIRTHDWPCPQAVGHSTCLCPPPETGYIHPLAYCGRGGCWERAAWAITVHTQHGADTVRVCEGHHDEVIRVLDSYRNLDYSAGRSSGALS